MAYDATHELALLLLASCVEALDTIPTDDPALLGAPERQFVSPGTPVLDCCEQLAVHKIGVTQADTSPAGRDAGRRHLHGTINDVTYHVSASRCIPTGTGDLALDYTPPSAASLTTAARQLNVDAWTLWNHLYWLQSSGLLLSLCSEVFFDGITPLAPSGGCAGWVAQVRCAVDGHQLVFGT